MGIPKERKVDMKKINIKLKQTPKVKEFNKILKKMKNNHTDGEREFRDKVLVHGSNAFLSEYLDNPELIMDALQKAIQTTRLETVREVRKIIYKNALISKGMHVKTWERIDKELKSLKEKKHSLGE